MDRARVPDQEIARLSADLVRADAAIREPLYLRRRKVVSVARLPCRLVRLCVEELLHQLVGARVDEQSAVLGPRVAEVDDALCTLQAAAERRLINVRPRRSPRLVLAIGKCDIESIERDQKLLRAPQRGKGREHAGLHARIPHELLVCHAVCREGVDLTLHGEVLLRPGLGIINVQIGTKTLEPCKGLLLIGLGSLSWDGTFDDGPAVLLEMIEPIKFIELDAGL